MAKLLVVGNLGGWGFLWLEILVVGNHLVDFSSRMDLVDVLISLREYGNLPQLGI